MEPAVAALFVCVSSLQWSHQEASNVFEALLSQCIPSPSSELPPPPLSLSSILSILLSEFPESWILPVNILLKYTLITNLFKICLSFRVSPADLPKALSYAKVTTLATSC